MEDSGRALVVAHAAHTVTRAVTRGASRGKLEALELRDGDAKRYLSAGAF